MRVAKKLASIHRLLVGHFSYLIRNTHYFVELVRNIRLKEGKCITSYDVTALFTSIPVDPAITIIKENGKGHITPQKNIHFHTSGYHIIRLCLKTSIFSFKVSLMKRSMEQPWGHPLVQLWPTCSWKSLKLRPSMLQASISGCKKLCC